MPRTRIEVAREVYEVFRNAEDAAEQSAAAIARCVAVLIEARSRAKLPPVAGDDILALMGECTTNALLARRQVIAAHPMLDDLAKQFGIVGFGPDKAPVPNEPFFTGATAPLRVVAAAG
jgi:hypothetical protein